MNRKRTTLEALKDDNCTFFYIMRLLTIAVAATLLVLSSVLWSFAASASDKKSNVYSLSLERFERGWYSTFLLDEVPVTVVHRIFENQVKAVEQLGINVRDNADLLEEIRLNAEIVIEPGRVVKLDWFVVSPINTGGFGCIVLPFAGDFDAFYDPCQDVHFDLWGKFRSGPTGADLMVLPWSISEDGKSLIVDVTGAPKDSWRKSSE